MNESRKNCLADKKEIGDKRNSAICQDLEKNEIIQDFADNIQEKDSKTFSYKFLMTLCTISQRMFLVTKGGYTFDKRQLGWRKSAMALKRLFCQKLFQLKKR